VWQARYGPGHYEVAVVLHNLAAVAQARGDTIAAEKLFLRALAIKADVLGAGHPELATLWHNLGSLHAAIGHDEQAGSCYQTALDILSTQEPDHPLTQVCHRALMLVTHKAPRTAACSV
jgi:tetratricopeptide (TPR) repeat protein